MRPDPLPPIGGSEVPRGLRGDLDGLSGRHTLAGLARPNPCVAPAAGVRNGKYCEAVGASGMPVKGSGDPHSSGKGAVSAVTNPLACLPAISCRPETKPYSGIYGELEIALGGTLTRLRCRGARGKRATPPRRGKIHNFSAKSRQRLQDLFSSINRKLAPHKSKFVTLTYPDSWERDPRVWQRHLNAFLKRLERAYGVFPVAIRKELQLRGAPHFHLLCFTKLFIPYQWVRDNWNSIVAPGDEAHLKAGTRVEAIRGWRGIHAYVSKYMAKLGDGAELPDGIGRLWGIRHRHLLPIAVPVFACTFEEFLTVRAAINGKRSAMGLSSRICSMFQGVRLYQSEQAARKLLRFIRHDAPVPQRVHDAPLFPDGVEPTEEWAMHHLRWWRRKQRPKLVLAEILAKISAQSGEP